MSTYDIPGTLAEKESQRAPTADPYILQSAPTAIPPRKRLLAVTAALVCAFVIIGGAYTYVGLAALAVAAAYVAYGGYETDRGPGDVKPREPSVLDDRKNAVDDRKDASGNDLPVVSSLTSATANAVSSSAESFQAKPDNPPEQHHTLHIVRAMELEPESPDSALPPYPSTPSLPAAVDDLNAAVTGSTSSCVPSQDQAASDLQTKAPQICSNPARTAALAFGPFDQPDNESNIRFERPQVQGMLTSVDELSPSANGLTSPSSPSINSPKIKAATEVKLIERLCYYPIIDSDLTTTFFLTYRSFLAPDVLLELLIRRYYERPPSGVYDTEVDMRPRVCNVLKVWVSEFWSEFEQDTALRMSLKRFVDIVCEIDCTKYGVGIRRLIHDHEEASNFSRQHRRNATALVDVYAVPAYCANRDALYDRLNRIDSEVLAQQLTLLESRLFSHIPVFEFLDQNWAKPHKAAKAPHLLRKIDSFNKFYSLVVTHVVTTSSLKDRARVIKRYIKLANECRNLNNFDSMLAIMAALQGSAVGRLALTWAEVPKAQKAMFTELETLVSPRYNYKGYRSALSNVTGPCVPYVGMFLSDLTFIDDGNPNFVNLPAPTSGDQIAPGSNSALQDSPASALNAPPRPVAPPTPSPTTAETSPQRIAESDRLRLVNFDKCRMASKTLRKIHAIQLAHYKLSGNKEVQEVLMELQAPGVALSEAETYQRSLEIEKRKSVVAL